MHNNWKYRRILLKISGEVIRKKSEGGFIDLSSLTFLAGQLTVLQKENLQIGIVVGGGNIIRGNKLVSDGVSRVMADHMGLLATIINSLGLQAALLNEGLKTHVMSAIPIPSITEPFNRETAIDYLERGHILIFGGGTGNPYFTTDSAAALRAAEIQADVLLKGTKVNGIYSADPKKNKNAVKYDSITYSEALKKELKVMDPTAFSLCMENKIPIIVFDIFDQNGVIKACTGKSEGTKVHS